MADGRRIIQVLNNLLTNAAGHSHKASAIGVSAVREGYHVAVSVTDEGRGIAAERLPHLFLRHLFPPPRPPPFVGEAAGAQNLTPAQGAC